MRNLRQATLLAGAGLLLLVPLAFAVGGSATDFKCEASADKAGAKFVGSKSKCVQKCLAGAWKTPQVNPFTDCNPPSYGGLTATCIQDPLKGAEGKFSIAIKKACDPATTASATCPSCYDSGNCSSSGYATDQPQNIEGQVDSFVPGVACEQAGASVPVQKCETSTSKALVKQVGGVIKCYDTCFANQRKGTAAPNSCDPPATDPATAACVNGVDTKAIAAANKLCGGECLNSVCNGVNTGLACSQNSDCGDQTVKPSCTNPHDYPTGSTWVNLVDIAISGNIPNTYCTEP